MSDIKQKDRIMTTSPPGTKWHYLEFPNRSTTIQPCNLLAVLEDQARYYREIADAIPPDSEMQESDVRYLIAGHPRWQKERMANSEIDLLNWSRGYLQKAREMADQASRTLQEIIRIAKQ